VSFVWRLKTTNNTRVSNLRIFTETIDVVISYMKIVFLKNNVLTFFMQKRDIRGSVMMYLPILDKYDILDNFFVFLGSG
jgi:hypothetical protein